MKMVDQKDNHSWITAIFETEEDATNIISIVENNHMSKVVQKVSILNKFYNSFFTKTCQLIFQGGNRMRYFN